MIVVASHTSCCHSALPSQQKEPSNPSEFCCRLEIPPWSGSSASRRHPCQKCCDTNVAVSTDVFAVLALFPVSRALETR